MVRIIFFFLASLFLAAPGIAQIQRSNIFLFDLKQVSDSAFTFSKPRYLTEFNADGYNNHPSFFGNDELYFSCQLPSMSQPDLYVFDLDKKTKTRVTRTAEGEYSPFRMPDFYSFSAIRQEISGRDTVLRLWQFPMDRLSNGRPVFKYVTGIGYYYWLNSYQVAIFKVDTPNSLGIADVRTDQVSTIATEVGRCIRKLPNGNLLYVKKSNFEPWKLVQLNPYNRQSITIAETVPGAEDFAVLRDGTILMGKGSRLYKFNPRKDEAWLEVADLRFYDIRNITRLAVSDDNKIAIVAE